MPTAFDEYLFSCRSLDEYRAMFGLSDGELAAARILDCPAGGASFVAETCAAGHDAIAADVLYSRSAPQLAAKAAGGVEKGHSFVLENPDNFTWHWFASPAQHLDHRRRACADYTADFVRPSAGARYVAAALPRLPFNDGTFTLTLSSHFLFTYADRLDIDFHEACIRELVRVSTREVRVFPLVSHQMVRHPGLDELRTRLKADGISTEIRRVEYEFQRGGNEMLAVSR